MITSAVPIMLTVARAERAMLELQPLALLDCSVESVLVSELLCVSVSVFVSVSVSVVSSVLLLSSFVAASVT